MFFYNIAFSLEFIVIALGAFLISWANHKSACAWKHREDVREVRPNLAGTTTGTEVHKTCHGKGGSCGTGLARTIGIILIILSIINVVDTLYHTMKYHRDVKNMRQRIEMIQKNNSNVMTPSNSNSNTTTTTPNSSGNSSTAQ